MSIGNRLWKSFTSFGWLAVAIPVFASFWIYYGDLNSKSLSGRVISQASLHPKGVEKMPGVIISVDNIQLATPYATTIEISNDGTRPILAADFESPIEIRVQEGVNIVRAQVGSMNPADLNPISSWDKNVVSIKPLLLNPKDSFTLSILSSGAEPQWTPKARVAGVSQLSFQSAPEKPHSLGFGWLLMIFALGLMVASQFVSESVFFKKEITISRGKSAYISIIVSLAAIIVVLLSYNQLGLSDWWLTTASTFFLFLISALISAYIDGKRDVVISVN